MIRHQVQPTRNSCVSTCLAMLADLPAREVVDEFHARYWQRPSSIIAIFDELDIVAVPCTMYDTIYFGWTYLICVPSCNIENGTHQIIVDASQGRQLSVIDPACGRIMDTGEPAKFYTSDNVFDGIWFPEWRILDCPAFRRD